MSTARTPEALVRLRRVLDVVALILGFTLAAGFAASDARGMPFSEVLALRVKVQNLLLFGAMLVVWSGIFSSFGLYRRHMDARLGDFKELVGAVSCVAVVLWMSRILFDIQLIGAEFILEFWMITLTLCVLARLLVGIAMRRLNRDGQNLRHALIVGTSQRGVDMAKRMEALPELGYQLIGFVDDQWTGNYSFQQSGYKVVTDFAGFADFVSRNVVDEVIICTPIKSFYDRSSKLLAQCEEQGITGRVVSDVFQPTLGRAYVERFNNQLVLTIDTGGMRGWAVSVKRVMDFSAAALLLTLLAPLFLGVAILIKIKSPGPVFFAQERMGRNKRRFRMFKFRTMVVNAEKVQAELEHLNEANGPVFKIRNDPRITPVGRFLRKTSLDELPQLINVLRGEMSLVGPRPLPVRDYEGFNERWHRRRFSVKPGMTCLWQIMGRNSIPFERWIELDMQYIDEWSLLLDFQILLRTIPAVLKGTGT